MLRATAAVALAAAVLVALAAQPAYAPYGACESYDFECCTNVQYQVFNVIADTDDKATCQDIDIIINGPLSNYSDECKNAWKDTYCLTAIGECCSTQAPVVFRTCASVCQKMMAVCDGSGLEACNDSSVFFPPPCNSGSGGPCNSAVPLEEMRAAPRPEHPVLALMHDAVIARSARRHGVAL